MIKFSVTLIFIFISFFDLQSQNENDVIDYTDISISDDFFEVENEEETTLNEMSVHEFNFQLLHLTRNKFNLEYRNNFSELFSFGLGLGYNYNLDNILHVSSQLDYIYELDEYSLSTLLINGSHKYGFNLNPSLRFFYDSYFFENVFVQLDYRYNFYRYLLNEDSPGLILETNFYYSSASLIFGIKGEFSINKKYSLINTAYYGIGGNYFTTYSIQDNAEFELKKPFEKETSISLRFIVGYSIGIGVK